MRIYNATYQNVIIDWANATLPIREGSPISADGKVSNDSDAIGLCPRYIWQEPLENKTVPILIGGDVVLPEVEAKYGSELTEDALASMGGINFYNDDGSIDKESGGGGGGESGYDLVITCNKNRTHNPLVSDYTIAEGSIEACEQKIANGEIVSAILIYSYVYGDGPYNDTQTTMYLSSFSVSYSSFEFYISSSNTYLVYNSEYQFVEVDYY